MLTTARHSKRFTSICFFAGSLHCIQVQVLAQDVACTASTVAFWRFDGDYTDSCGNIDGTPVGAASIAMAGCAPLLGNSGCLVLTGSPSRVDLPAPFNPTYTGALSAGTIEAWVYFEGNKEGNGVIFNHGVAATSTDLSPGIQPHPGGGYDSRFHAASTPYPVFLLPGFTLNTWHHLAWTWNTTTVTWYLDGLAIGTVAGPLSVSFTGNEAEIGSDDQEVGYWVGRLDAIRLSNQVLTPSEFLLTPKVPSFSHWGLAVISVLILVAGAAVFCRRVRLVTMS